MIFTITVTLSPEESRILSKEKIRDMIIKNCKQNGLEISELKIETVGTS